MNKKILVTLILLCTMVAIVAAQGSNPAQQPPRKPAPATDPPAASAGNPSAVLAAGFKLGFIDLERAMTQTDEGKREVGELEKFYNEKAVEIKEKQDKLEKLKKQLREQEKNLNEDTKAQMQRDISKEERNLERDTEDAQREFETRRNSTINKIGTKMQPLINALAKEQSYAAIFVYSQQTPLFAYIDVDKYDVTNDIIKRYNATHPAASVAAKPASEPAVAKPAPVPTAKPKK